MDLTGKKALITGGSSGVGADMARRFADLGAEVWIVARRADALATVADHSTNIKTITADVSREEDVARMFEVAGPCDIVIANAGVSMGKQFVKTTLDDWHYMMDVNLTGVFLTMREGLRTMPKGWGRMIVVASIAGLRGVPHASVYAATKHGVVGLVKSVAYETAQTGITVNALCPGYLNTEMTDKNIDVIVQKTGMSRDDAAKLLTKDNPQGRMIEASEVTDAALYLISDGATSVNGHPLVISGGMDT